MAVATNASQKGVYNVEYFSGTQASIYIGDVWVDEVTSFAYGVFQNRRPLYGYSDMLFRDVAKGQVLVQGQFSINFKEAGYLWLVLRRYHDMLRSLKDPREQEEFIRAFGSKTPFIGSVPYKNEDGKTRVLTNNVIENKQNIERLINGQYSTYQKNQALTNLASQASLLGLPSNKRLGRNRGNRSAESIFEAFEDRVWQGDQSELDEEDRRADDPRLNPFDMYILYGDFAGDDRVNHTIHKLSNMHITGSSRQIVIDGQPIQEQYSFIARNLV